MSIWTQAFLVNWIVLIAYINAAAAVGSSLHNYVLYSNSVGSWLIAVHTLLSVVSIPVWLIYLVIS